MSTKKLLLKLFLAAIFLAALPTKTAHAAKTLDINRGSITITREGATQNDTVVNDTTYIITAPEGGTTGNRTISVDMGVADNPSSVGTLNLTFDNVDYATGGITLDIKNAIVNLTLQGSNRLRATSGSAITIDKNSQLFFRSSNPRNNIYISGAINSPVVSGGQLYVQNGRVTLEASGSGVPFNGESATVSGGRLECLKGASRTNFGNGTLVQNGGNVYADGLAYINYEDEAITGVDLHNYNLWLRDANSGYTKVDATISDAGSSNSYLVIRKEWYGRNFRVEPAVGTDGVVQTFTLPTEYDPPKNLQVRSDESTAGKNDGSISGADATMEYSNTGEPSYNWKACTATKEDNQPYLNGKNLEGLSPGNYYFRYAYSEDDNKFASDPVGPIPIKRGSYLEIDTPTLPDRPYKYETAPEGEISIKNIDSTEGASITVTNLSVSNTDAFEIVDFRSDSLDASGAAKNWKIRPKTGLDAGTYTTGITVGYNDPDGAKTISQNDVISFTVTKLSYPTGEAYPVPATPEFVNSTFESITLKAIETKGIENAEVEYSKDNGDTWQSSPVFTGLESNRNYKFLARYAETKNYEASESSELSPDYSTERKVEIIYDTKQLNLLPNRRYQISTSSQDVEAIAALEGDTNHNAYIDIMDKWFGKTITIVDREKNTSQELRIPDIASAPETPKGKAESFSGAGDGQLTGVTTAMEYKLEGSDGWTPCRDTTIHPLAPGTYLVRTMAITDGDNLSFASDAIKVEIKKGPAITVTPESVDFGTSPYKKVPDPRVITFQNHDQNNDVTIKSITLNENSPFSVIHGETDSNIVSAGKTNETWKLQPNEDLNVGTYTDEFVVTYSIAQDINNGANNEQVEALAEGDGENNTGDPAGDNTGGQEVAAIEEKTDPISITFTVEKADQDAPPVPVEKSKTSTSITLETIPDSPMSGAKAQYSKDGGKTWQDTPTFTGLAAERDYTFTAKYAATDNYNEAVSDGENTITTNPRNSDTSSPQDSNSNDANNGSNGTSGSSANGSNTTTGSNGSGSSNGSSGSGTNGSGSTGSNGTSGSGNGTNGTSGTITSAKTGDMNNIQLWVTLAVISYLSCMIIIRNKMKQSKA